MSRRTPPNVNGDQAEVRAAGGVVRRRARRYLLPRTELAVVHRPRYHDWSFPKGKRDGDESDEQTALREVAEETGLHCELREPLGTVRYRDARGRDKVVHYWTMEPLSDPRNPFVPNREVDEVRWCTGREARKLLSYDHDRALLARLPRRRPPTEKPSS